MGMLMVMKNDLKRMEFVLILILAANLTFFIIFASLLASAKEEYYFSTWIIFAYIFIFAIPFYTIAYTLFDTTKWMSIYQLSNVKEMTVIWVRAVFIFLINVFAMLVFFAEVRNAEFGGKTWPIHSKLYVRKPLIFGFCNSNRAIGKMYFHRLAVIAHLDE